MDKTTEPTKTYIVDARIAITDSTEQGALMILDDLKAGATVDIGPWRLDLAEDATMTADQLAD